jgi:diadenosine tetraphosphate (Ap4A) HIT family hydrolase
MKPPFSQDCPLCTGDGGDVLWRDDFVRVVLVDDPDHIAFCRVIVAPHVREMTDLAAADRARVMHAVYATETALRAVYAPHKVNLASLGNAVPHVHWHVIGRFADDPHFPNPIWGERVRMAPQRLPVVWKRDALQQALVGELAALR